jgi:hypothetical protein
VSAPESDGAAPACVVTLVDRLPHPEVLHIEGQSYRAKEAKERTAANRAGRATGDTPSAFRILNCSAVRPSALRSPCSISRWRSSTPRCVSNIRPLAPISLRLGRPVRSLLLAELLLQRCFELRDLIAYYTPAVDNALDADKHD